MKRHYTIDINFNQSEEGSNVYQSSFAIPSQAQGVSGSSTPTIPSSSSGLTPRCARI